VNELLAPDSRICVVLLTGVGDVVHGLPVVNAIKAHAPACHLTWVVEPTPSAVLRHHPAVDEIVVYERSRGVRGVLDLRRRLRERCFDLTLNLNVYFKSVWPTLFSAAPSRVGFGREHARDGVWLASNRHVHPHPRNHTLDRFLAFLPVLGVPVPKDPEWRIRFSDAEERAAARFFEALGERPVAAVIPASARPEKDWPAERSAATIDALHQEHGFRVVLVGGPGPREQRVAREIVRSAHTEPVWALGDDLRRSMWLLRGSRLVIGPDTGPLHLARAFGVPTIGLFGHTNPRRVGPYRWSEELSIDAYHDADEPPGFSNAPRPGRMERITVDDVLGRVRVAAARVGTGAR
jgi:heptosyltransferase I